MRKFLLMAMMIAGLQGCVIGYGRCKLTEPMKSSLVGHVRFRDFSANGRVDRAPILVLDRIEYVYAPSLGKQCRSILDVQLMPFSDLPDDIVEGAHVAVEGSLVLANREGQHTRFVFNLETIRLIKP